MFEYHSEDVRQGEPAGNSSEIARDSDLIEGQRGFLKQFPRTTSRVPGGLLGSLRLTNAKPKDARATVRPTD